MVTLQINWPIVFDCRPFHRRRGCFVFQLRVFRFQKLRGLLGSFPIRGCFLFTCWSFRFSFVFIICFAAMKYAITKTFDQEIWSGTAYKKMAAVKREHLSNIIKMKFTEEKSYWNFCLRQFLAEVRLSVLGMCITEAVRARVAEFDFLTENLDSGC